jgi:hypothetical protein
MGDHPDSRVSRVRAGASHRSTLVTKWRVKVTGIEFIKDVYLSENGNNRSDKPPDTISYPKIKENFHGWGRGPYLTDWDWQGSDNLERAACYVRLKPVVMKVRLRCDLPAPSARTFVLVVTPSLGGDEKLLTPGSKSVDWPKGSKEQVVEIATGGALPDEVSRYGLQLTWSVKDVAISAPDGTTSPGITGVINKSRHTIFSIYDLPREPSDNSETGRDFYTDSGLTKQRLDKITLVIGGSKRRFPTAKASDLDELVWRVHQNVNDSNGPLYFNGERSFKILYNLKPDKKAKTTKTKAPIEVGVVDQWVMWAPSGEGYNGPSPHWNYGACITYIQLMKTMLATVGIHARLAWVIPKTTLLPTVDTPVTLAESDVVDFDSHSDLPTQKHEFTSKSGVKWEAEVVLMERPEKGGWEQFEGCLWFNNRFYPGAIPTTKYPDSLQRGHQGFSSGIDVLKWWISVSHGKFQRFMVWKAESPALLFFDVNGAPFPNAYDIDPNDHLPFGQ